MQSVKVNKHELLNILKLNREKHLAEFNSASKIFIQDAIDKLTEMLSLAQQKGRIIQNLGLTEPKSYVESYDTAIAMLNMSVDNEIELTETEFLQYVQDNWTWKHTFTSTTQFYNSKLAL